MVGRWFRSKLTCGAGWIFSSLNPYLVGRWFRRVQTFIGTDGQEVVLILIWLEDGLEDMIFLKDYNSKSVLILIWLEDGLEEVTKSLSKIIVVSLNPYLVGRWFRRAAELLPRGQYQSVLILIWLEDGLEAPDEVSINSK